MLDIAQKIKENCILFAEQNGATDARSLSFVVDITKDISKGDLYTNLPFVLAGKITKNPVAIALELQHFLEANLVDTDVLKTEVAGGYVNFWVKENTRAVPQVVFHHAEWTGKKIIFDYTDPNPMKEFHIGHLMSNTIGESLVRLAELGGAEVRRYSYQGDVGRHIAVTIWGLQWLEAGWPDESVSLTDKVKHLGSAYVAGNQKLAALKEKGEENAEYVAALAEIDSINKQLYDRTDDEINKVYDEGREWSLEKFEELYEILGTKFDAYFFESKAGPLGLEIIKQHPEVFATGEEGATIFEGEKYDLHTRVFVNKNGLPTYEGKEIGLTKLKWDMWPFDRSYVVTANEQNEVFKVTKKAISMIMPEAGERSFHIGHGMMKFVGEKMSSRTGKIIAGDELVYKMMEASFEKMKEREIAEERKHDIAKDVAVAAIKFTILKQNVKKDIIFDPEKALALEGDSGPYIQYAAVRISSLLKKVDTAMKDGAEKTTAVLNDESRLLQRTMLRFEHVCLQAIDEMAPQHIAQYLIELAGCFNSFYANTKIINTTDGKITVRGDLMELCKVTLEMIEKGLDILGIRTVDEM